MKMYSNGKSEMENISRYLKTLGDDFLNDTLMDVYQTNNSEYYLSMKRLYLEELQNPFYVIAIKISDYKKWMRNNNLDNLLND